MSNSRNELFFYIALSISSVKKSKSPKMSSDTASGRGGISGTASGRGGISGGGGGGVGGVSGGGGGGISGNMLNLIPGRVSRLGMGKSGKSFNDISVSGGFNPPPLLEALLTLIASVCPAITSLALILTWAEADAASGIFGKVFPKSKLFLLFCRPNFWRFRPEPAKAKLDPADPAEIPGVLGVAILGLKAN